MAYFPDLTTSSPFACGPAIRAVGWLEQGRDYPTGKVRSRSRFLRDLQAIRAESHLPSDFPFRFDEMGMHTCQFCRDHHDTGDLLVPHGDLVFVAPTMIAHYVQSHEYLPPAEFVKAVSLCPLPSTPEYREAIRFAIRSEPGGEPRLSRA